MKSILVSALTALFALSLPIASPAAAEDPMEPRWSIAIHGGAGTLSRKNMTPEKQAEYEAALQQALDAGVAILAEGGSAMDAVMAAVIPLEDNPLFNAGRGAVFTWEGENELDASIMDGSDRSAGAVSGVKGIKNPILLADAVRTSSPHVFLSGAGAEQFASEQGLETAPREWFETEGRKKALERRKARELSAVDVDHKFGTVGAVALDLNGNVAAATSTGGMTGKRWGRIGDSPVIGAGTYADDRSCAVSATGWGEYFLRVGVAQEICTRLRYRFRMDLNQAQATVPKDEDGNYTYAIHAYEMALEAKAVQEEADGVMREVADLGGDGGVIVVTPDGHAIFSFNTAGMYRGRATSAGVNEVAIFGGEEPNEPSATPDH